MDLLQFKFAAELSIRMWVKNADIFAAGALFILFLEGCKHYFTSDGAM